MGRPYIIPNEKAAELYNLVDELHEMTNAATRIPETVREPRGETGGGVVMR